MKEMFRRRDARSIGRSFPAVGATLLAAVAALVPRVACACPVCFSAGSERVSQAYYLTAALMTLLPLVIAALLAGWLRQRFKQEPK